MLILFAEGQIGQDYISVLRNKGFPLSVQLKIAGPFDSVCFSKINNKRRWV